MALSHGVAGNRWRPIPDQQDHCEPSTFKMISYKGNLENLYDFEVLLLTSWESYWPQQSEVSVGFLKLVDVETKP